MPTIQVNDLRMYYELHGTGEPLVLIGGLGTDLSEWSSLIGWLAQQYRVIAFDNRGAGRTDKPDQPYSIAQMAGDTEGLLRALAIERAHIVGISMGGRIALALALAHPERIDRLVLVSTSARTARRSWWFGPLSLLSSVPILRSRYPQPRYAFRRQRQASSTFNCTDRLREIHAPTLILHGTRDKTVPYALAGDAASFAIAGTTTLTLHLSAPIALQRFTGPTPPVATLHLTADDPDRLARALRERLAHLAAIPSAAS